MVKVGIAGGAGYTAGELTRLLLCHPEAEIKYMTELTEDISGFEYVTREAWSHSDLNCGNILYDKEKSQISH